MLFDRVGVSRARLLFICRATVPALIILITTVSCSGPPANLPPKQPLVQRDAAQAKAAQAKVGRPASKKASTPAQLDEKEELLFLEFLEWRSRQKDRGEVRSLH
jgi:hypothetical protein